MSVSTCAFPVLGKVKFKVAVLMNALAGSEKENLVFNDRASGGQTIVVAMEWRSISLVGSNEFAESNASVRKNTDPTP